MASKHQAMVRMGELQNFLVIDQDEGRGEAEGKRLRLSLLGAVTETQEQHEKSAFSSPNKMGRMGGNKVM